MVGDHGDEQENAGHEQRRTARGDDGRRLLIQLGTAARDREVQCSIADPGVTRDQPAPTMPPRRGGDEVMDDADETRQRRKRVEKGAPINAANLIAAVLDRAREEEKRNEGKSSRSDDDNESRDTAEALYGRGRGVHGRGDLLTYVK